MAQTHRLPIWYLFMAIGLGFWATVAATAIVAMAIKRLGESGVIAGAILLFVWATGIIYASYQYEMGRRALADARNPQTSPARLAELVHFNGIQSGYELDNRLASNPNTPPEVLRELSLRGPIGN